MNRRRRYKFFCITVTIRNREVSIWIGKTKITIKSERNDPVNDTQKIRKDDK